MVTNEQQLDGIFDAIFTGGGSMRGGKSLQGQIADAEAAAAKALAAPLIVGWPGPNGTTYSTSVLQQLVYITKDLQTVKTQNAELKVQNDELKAAIAAITAPAITVEAAPIDYDVLATKIAAKMPNYKLTPETPAPTTGGA